ncbi:MAG: hypothetical protein A4E35_01952 [Methanoregula sp. PtaU1.Bin051]|nr:MAG: hypothetical protein A4E35_01952 [Methanoregula sp. PtaU1.Bin051]
MTATEKETAGQGIKSWFGSKCNVKEHVPCRGGGGALYGLGFLGALVYYLTTATDLVSGLFGIIKALLWPAFLVYGVMKFIGM